MKRLDEAANSLAGATLNRDDYWSQRLLLANYRPARSPRDARSSLRPSRQTEEWELASLTRSRSGPRSGIVRERRADVERFAEGLRSRPARVKRRTLQNLIASPGFSPEP